MQNTTQQDFDDIDWFSFDAEAAERDIQTSEKPLGQQVGEWLGIPQERPETTVTIPEFSFDPVSLFLYMCAGIILLRATQIFFGYSGSLGREVDLLRKRVNQLEGRD